VIANEEHGIVSRDKALLANVDSFQLRVESFLHSYRHACYVASIGNRWLSTRAGGWYLQRYSGTNLQHRTTLTPLSPHRVAQLCPRLQLDVDETASQLRIFF